MFALAKCFILAGKKGVRNHIRQNSQPSIQTMLTPFYSLATNDPSKLARYLLSRGGLAWSPTAHVEQYMLPPSLLVISLGMGAD